MKRTKFLPTRGSSPYDSSWRTTISGYDTVDNDDLRGITKEFLCNTSIHGMKYLGERGRSICERIFWLLLVTAGCVLSVYACYLEWYKWKDSPILITRDPTVITHDPLNFPIVTVCSTNKISKRKLEAIIQNPKYSWMNFTGMARMIRYLTKFDPFVNPDEDFPRFLYSLIEHNVTMDDMIKVVHEVSPTCNDTFVDCQWKSNVVDCGRLFSPLLTDDGFCCSSDIDVLDKDQILRSNDSDRSSTVYEYGIHSALRIILDPNPDDSAGNAVAFDGFKVLLHNKEEFPDVSERGFIIGTGHENFVALNLNSVWYTSDIASISFEKRRCYVDGEKKLKYIKNLNYSRSSCLYECRMESIINECNCLPYFIQANISGVPSCSFHDYQCVARFYGEKLAALSRFCNCPAACNDHWYTTEISSAPFSPAGFPMTKSFRRVSKTRKIDAKDSVRLIGLRIFFKYNAGDSFKMDVPFGNKELLASMGGLLGFGLGFSAISAVELCYFLCCRWCFRRKRKVSATNYNWATRNVVFSHPKRQSTTIHVSPVNKDGTLNVSTISK